MDDAARKTLERRHRMDETARKGIGWQRAHEDRRALLLALANAERDRDVALLQRDAHAIQLNRVWNDNKGDLKRYIVTLEARLARVEGALRWALGEKGDFPPRAVGEGAYWWRKELRRRAALTYDATTEGT